MTVWTDGAVVIAVDDEKAIAVWTGVASRRIVYVVVFMVVIDIVQRNLWIAFGTRHSLK
jgi:hypothetical protein